MTDLRRFARFLKHLDVPLPSALKQITFLFDFFFFLFSLFCFLHNTYVDYLDIFSPTNQTRVKSQGTSVLSDLEGHPFFLCILARPRCFFFFCLKHIISFDIGIVFSSIDMTGISTNHRPEWLQAPY